MSTYTCPNCGFKTQDIDDLEVVTDLRDRLDPGDTMPDGECPDCGALCFEDKPTPKLVIVVSGGNIQSMHASQHLDLDIVVIDHDNIEATEAISTQGDEIEAAAIADCPVAVMWDDHEDCCEECGDKLDPDATMSCPDGAIICRGCFDAGKH